jgi:hypothetical protein
LRTHYPHKKLPCCILQAVASAHKALSSALAGVTLSGDEQEVLARRLKAAADKKLGDLLQVRKGGIVWIR